jgi:hypothetical protein
MSVGRWLFDNLVVGKVIPPGMAMHLRRCKRWSAGWRSESSGTRRGQAKSGRLLDQRLVACSKVKMSAFGSGRGFRGLEPPEIARTNPIFIFPSYSFDGFRRRRVSQGVDFSKTKPILPGPGRRVGVRFFIKRSAYVMRAGDARSTGELAAGGPEATGAHRPPNGRRLESAGDGHPRTVSPARRLVSYLAARVRKAIAEGRAGRPFLSLKFSKRPPLIPIT